MPKRSATELAAVSGPAERAGFPEHLGASVREVRIRNGEVVHLRPIRPDDATMLVAFHEGLSPQSIYLRYFNFHPVLTTREIERFTRVDYEDRLALVVLAKGRIVAVGRYDRLAGTDDAEVAFLVEDDYQGQGVGTLLADELARAARTRGIRAFVADTLPENAGMLQMFRGTGFPVRCRFEEGVVKVLFPIDPDPAYLEALARREADRGVQGVQGVRDVQGAQDGSEEGAPASC